MVEVGELANTTGAPTGGTGKVTGTRTLVDREQGNIPHGLLHLDPRCNATAGWTRGVGHLTTQGQGYEGGGCAYDSQGNFEHWTWRSNCQAQGPLSRPG